MRKIIFYHNSLEQENLNKVLREFNFYSKNDDCIETIGLSFPRNLNILDEFGSNVWAVAYVVNEKKYLLSKIRYGI